jgi:phenylalanyl-tRNA synthetase alpha subunit
MMEIFATETIGMLGAELTKLAIKGTATTVAKKVMAIKHEKDVKNIRKVYDEIINELIQERDEAIRIAQSYKSELDRVEISDKDIEHLHNTISRILEILKKMSPVSMTAGGESNGFESFEQLNELINTDTLKTMQLLGFNFKAAIGEPFTALCANAISSLGAKRSQNTSNIKLNRK